MVPCSDLDLTVIPTLPGWACGQLKAVVAQLTFSGGGSVRVVSGAVRSGDFGWPQYSFGLERLRSSLRVVEVTSIRSLARLA